MPNSRRFSVFPQWLSYKREPKKCPFTESTASPTSSLEVHKIHPQGVRNYENRSHPRFSQLALNNQVGRKVENLSYSRYSQPLPNIALKVHKRVFPEALAKDAIPLDTNNSQRHNQTQNTPCQMLIRPCGVRGPCQSDDSNASKGDFTSPWDTFGKGESAESKVRLYSFMEFLAEGSDAASGEYMPYETTHTR